MSELKPCPFCGEPVVFNKFAEKVVCEDCGATIYSDYWNTRPIEDALANHIIKLEAEIAKLRTAQGYDASGEKAEAMVKLLKTTIDIPKRYEDLWFEREWLVNKLAFAEKCIAELEAENAKLRAKLDAGETVDQLGKPDWVGKEVRK